MDKVIVAVVVIIAVGAHVALYRWVKFKIHEGVVLQYLRDARDNEALEYHHAAAIADHTELPAERVTAICRRSREITSHPQDGSWRAS